MSKKAVVFKDWAEYREYVKKQPETAFQKIELEILDKVIAEDEAHA